MAGNLDPPLVPKNGHRLELLIPARVSGVINQDERSLDDQRASAEKWIKAATDLPFQLPRAPQGTDLQASAAVKILVPSIWMMFAG